jgi:hypothetical protein
MDDLLEKRRILLGGIILLLWLIFVHPNPLESAWGEGLLFLAALVVVPLAIKVVASSHPYDTFVIFRQLDFWQAPAAVCLMIAYGFEEGLFTKFLVLPWVVILYNYARVGLRRLTEGAWRSSSDFSIAMGLAYLGVAGIWLFMERIGIAPLGFSHDITFLTIAHFHYAGFVLPLLVGLATRQLGNPVFGQVTCYFTVGAMAWVAIGITVTQVGGSPYFEMAGAWLMALTGIGAALLQIKLAMLGHIPLKIRLLWLCSAMALVAGMALAGLYGSRFVAPVSWLNIPMMRALHGTLNAVGYGLLGVLGHHLFLDKAFPKH